MSWMAGLGGVVIGVVLTTGVFWLKDHAPAARSAEAASRPAPTPPVDKPAYLVVLGEVLDRDRFARDYVAVLPPVYAKYGGSYLAAGRNFEVLEGEGDFRSFVISKWPSMDAAKTFWTSAEYDALRRARIEGNLGRFDVYLLEGLPEAAASPPIAREAPR